MLNLRTMPLIAIFAVSVATAYQAPGRPEPQPAAPTKTPLTFDAASVRPFDPARAAGRSGGGSPQIDELGRVDPGRVHYIQPLRGFLRDAYAVKDYQVVGPGWLSSELFTLDATMSPDTTTDQLRVMFQNLLVERFKLVIHRESKELPMHTLVVAKNGPKLTTTPSSATKERGDSGLDRDGFPLMPPEYHGTTLFVIHGRARLRGQQATMQDLANELVRLFRAPVAEATQLKEPYDFTLTFSPEGLNGPRGELIPAPPPDAGPLADLFTALQSELGLKLESKKGPVDVIVVDRVEKTPTGN
jgi:uncharacterized protein (TIGR03435 family)